MGIPSDVAAVNPADVLKLDSIMVLWMVNPNHWLIGGKDPIIQADVHLMYRILRFQPAVWWCRLWKKPSTVVT